ncbi:MAG: hypothetical protein Q9166_000717 [cf. Caloplaca sp. 2 TL-2023]
MAKHFVSPDVKNMRDLAIMIREAIHEVLANKQNITAAIKAQHSISHGLLSSSSLPDIEKSAARLHSEGTMLVLAGTESTAKLLSTTYYHLLAHPSMLSRVRAEPFVYINFHLFRLRAPKTSLPLCLYQRRQPPLLRPYWPQRPYSL